MKKYQLTFFVGTCEVNVSVLAENEKKAYQIATLRCIESKGNIKTVKIN